MLKSDFSNYTGLNGRGNYLVRELLYLVEQAQQHPQTAAQLETLFNADVARVQAAITAAKARPRMSGPGGGPIKPVTGFSLTGSATVIDEANVTLTIAPTPSDGSYDASDVIVTLSSANLEFVSKTKTQVVVKGKVVSTGNTVTVRIGNVERTHTVAVTAS